jgi:hypothetical protein
MQMGTQDLLPLDETLGVLGASGRPDTGVRTSGFERSSLYPGPRGHRVSAPRLHGAFVARPADAAGRRRRAGSSLARHIQQVLVGRQSNQTRLYVNRDRCPVMVVVGSSRPGLAPCRPPRSQRRRKGSAPSKAAKDAPIRPPPIGGDYTLLPRGLTFLASHRIRRVFYPCGDERGACGSRSRCLRSFAGRKLPTDASGRGKGDP